MQNSILEPSNRLGVPGAIQLAATKRLGSTYQTSLFEAQYSEASRMRRADQEAAIARVAERAVATWEAVDACLSATLGPKAVAALYCRSLYLTRIEHPWLVAAFEGGSTAAILNSLKSAVLRQTVGHANAALTALMCTFRDLLVQLLGESLAERLLEPVGTPPVNPC